MAGQSTDYTSDWRRWCGSVDATAAAAAVATSAAARWNQAWFVLRRLTRSRRLIKYAPPGWRPYSRRRVWARLRVGRSQEGRRARRRSLSLRFDQYRTAPNSSSSQRLSLNLAYLLLRLWNPLVRSGYTDNVRTSHSVHVSFYLFVFFIQSTFSTDILKNSPTWCPFTPSRSFAMTTNSLNCTRNKKGQKPQNFHRLCT